MTLFDVLLLIVFMPLFLISVYLVGDSLSMIICVIADVVGIMREKAKKKVAEFFT